MFSGTVIVLWLFASWLRIFCVHRVFNVWFVMFKLETVCLEFGCRDSNLFKVFFIQVLFRSFRCDILRLVSVFILLLFVESALRVHPAVTRLTVYRRP